MIKRRILALLTMLLTALTAVGQTYPEYFYLATDKAFYLAGETIWYNLHLLNGQQRVSGIAYVELTAPDGEVVQQQRLRLEEGILSGDLVLPGDLSTGYYQLRAFTRWNLGFEPAEIEAVELPVYQPTVPEGAPLAEVSAYEPQATHLALELSTEQLRPRQALTVGLQADQAQPGQVSLSLVHEAQVAQRETIAERLAEVQAAAVPSRKRSENFAPEQSFTLTFAIDDPEGQPVTSNFIVGFVRQTQKSLQGKAKNGRVELAITEVYDSTVIQLFDANPFKPAYVPRVKLVQTELAAPRPAPNLARPPFTPAVVSYIQRYQQRYQLEPLLRTGEVLAPVRQPLARRELDPDLSFPITDFIPMENLADFANQAVPPLQVKPFRSRSKKEPRVMGMDDPTQSIRLFVPHRDIQTEGMFQQRPPLLMVNGYLTYDHQAVLNTTWSKVEQVDVYNDLGRLPFLFGPIGNYGVVAFRTYNNETPPRIQRAPNTVPIQGFYRGRSFTPVRQTPQTEDGSRLPDFRSLLAWESPLSLDGNGQAQPITLTVGDQAGRYLLRVEGLLADGTPIVAERWIEVQR